MLKEQSYLHCTYTNLTALIKEQKIKPLRPLLINLESYSNTVVRGWLAITNVSVFNELFYQKKHAALSIYFEVNYFKGVSILYHPYWAPDPTEQPILFVYLQYVAERAESQLKRTSIARSVPPSFRLWGQLLGPSGLNPLGRTIVQSYDPWKINRLSLFMAFKTEEARILCFT